MDQVQSVSCDFICGLRLVCARLEQGWFGSFCFPSKDTKKNVLPLLYLVKLKLKLKQEENARRDLQDQVMALGAEENRLSAELRTLQAARNDAANPTSELEAALQIADKARVPFSFPRCVPFVVGVSGSLWDGAQMPPPSRSDRHDR